MIGWICLEIYCIKHVFFQMLLSRQNQFTFDQLSSFFVLFYLATSYNIATEVSWFCFLLIVYPVLLNSNKQPNHVAQDFFNGIGSDWFIASIPEQLGFEGGYILSTTKKQNPEVSQWYHMNSMTYQSPVTTRLCSAVCSGLQTKQSFSAPSILCDYHEGAVMRNTKALAPQPTPLQTTGVRGGSRKVTHDIYISCVWDRNWMGFWRKAVIYISLYVLRTLPIV